MSYWLMVRRGTRSSRHRRRRHRDRCVACPPVERVGQVALFRCSPRTCPRGRWPGWSTRTTPTIWPWWPSEAASSSASPSTTAYPDSDVAEVAFVVDDAYQGLGIGTLLLEYLASEGRRHGFKRFAADTLLENNAMLQVFRGRRFHAALRPGVRASSAWSWTSPLPEALARPVRARPQSGGPFDATVAAAALDRGHWGVPFAGDGRP